jgi:mono/diheme cytochrome c family protein
MNTSLRNVVLILALPVVLGIALAAGPAWPRKVNSEPAAKEANSEPAAKEAVKGSVPKWVKVSVDLPVSEISFPPGNGSVIANAYCLICHSAGMVLRQPPLTQDEWTGEIDKMRNAFGAPIPADQIQALARYLRSINGRQPQKGPSAVDGKAS